MGRELTPDILPSRLQGKIIVHSVPNVHTGTPCWQCTCRANRNGYRRIWDGTREPVAHRYAWEHVHGPIAAGLLLDHLCRLRACVRLDHLEPVTPRVNTLRGNAVLFKSAGVCVLDHDPAKALLGNATEEGQSIGCRHSFATGKAGL